MSCELHTVPYFSVLSPCPAHKRVSAPGGHLFLPSALHRLQDLTPEPEISRSKEKTHLSQGSSTAQVLRHRQWRHLLHGGGTSPAPPGAISEPVEPPVYGRCLIYPLFTHEAQEP